MDMVHTIWLLCCLHVQSPGSLIATDGRWLTGCDVDAVQTLLKNLWSGHGLLSVTSHFTAPLPRPFVQVLDLVWTANV